MQAYLHCEHACAHTKVNAQLTAEKEALEFIEFYTTGAGSKDKALEELFYVCFIQCSVVEVCATCEHMTD